MCWQRLYCRGDSVSLGLFRQHTLGFVSVSLTLSILLVRILNRNLLAHDILVVHAGDSRVGGFEVAVRDETIALGCARDVVARNLWRIH